MKFLLTNDDGIDAPGLNALAEACRGWGQVWIVAPQEHLSGCSHQATTDNEIAVRPSGTNRYAVAGTPVDCVRVGLAHIATNVDWVLAGINNGGNLGVDVLMSGTVAAAREAALLGTRSIAFSQYRQANQPIDWNAATQYVVRTFDELRSQEMKKHTFWNVNFPHITANDENVTTTQRTSDQEPQLSFCPLDQNPLPVQFKKNQHTYKYCGVYGDRQRTAGADVDTCFGGHIAISRLSVYPHTPGIDNS